MAKSIKNEHIFIIALIIIFITILIFYNSLFWQFFDKYFVMPIMADVTQIGGASEGGYNVFNTITYSVLLVAGIFAIYKLMQKFNFKLDERFFVALLPFVILGGVWRVLEDMQFVKAPYAYLLISPVIYIFIGAIVIAIIIACFITKKAERMSSVILYSGTALLLLSVIPFFLVSWKHAEALAIISGSFGAALAVTFLSFRVLSLKTAVCKAFLTKPSLALFAAHFLDASATFVGIDFYNYGEKHVLPSLLINIFGTAVVMYALKFIVVALVVYLLDIKYKALLDSNAKWLVRICVFILGAAPGIRDALRISVGA